jgi:hypothetical protein
MVALELLVVLLSIQLGGHARRVHVLEGLEDGAHVLGLLGRVHLSAQVADRRLNYRLSKAQEAIRAGKDLGFAAHLLRRARLLRSTARLLTKLLAQHASLLGQRRDLRVS